MTTFLSRPPFKILSRSRWERIRMALDAWPRMLDNLDAENTRLRAELAQYRSAMKASGQHR